MLAAFYSNLEALVYEEEVEESEDVTKPPTDDQDKKIFEFVDAITEEFGTVTIDIFFRSIYSFIYLNSSKWVCFRVHRTQ